MNKSYVIFLLKFLAFILLNFVFIIRSILKSSFLSIIIDLLISFIFSKFIFLIIFIFENSIYSIMQLLKEFKIINLFFLSSLYNFSSFKSIIIAL